MTKLACIPCTLATQYLAGDRFPDGATLATLVPLVGGLYVAEVHDHTVTPLGTLYGAVAVVATVLAQRATASSAASAPIKFVAARSAPDSLVGLRTGRSGGSASTRTSCSTTRRP